MPTTTTAYQDIVTSLAKRQATIAKDPSVALATKYYANNISKVKTAEEFVNNYRLFSYAMKAYDLSDKIPSKALMKKILTQDPSDSKALVNTLNDPRLKAFAKAFNFFGKGADATSQASATTDATSKYIESKLEDKAGASNQGVQLALYFKRQAPNVSSVYGILADRQLLKVVQTVFNIPAATSMQSVDTQAATLKKFIDPADFKDAAKMTKLLSRFTANYDVANGVSGTDAATSTALAPFSSGSNFGVSADLLFSLQSIRLGGG